MLLAAVVCEVCSAQYFASAAVQQIIIPFHQCQKAFCMDGEIKEMSQMPVLFHFGKVFCLCSLQLQQSEKGKM